MDSIPHLDMKTGTCGVISTRTLAPHDAAIQNSARPLHFINLLPSSLTHLEYIFRQLLTSFSKIRGGISFTCTSGNRICVYKTEFNQ